MTFEYIKVSDSTKNEKLDSIGDKLTKFSDLPNNINEEVAYTFKEIQEDIKEYKNINKEATEECFDNMNDTIKRINKNNTDLIRKIEDELSEIRNTFVSASNDLQIQIRELSNQTQIFIQTMNHIMCQLMKMSEEDAKVIREMLNED